MVLQIISWYKFFARRIDGLTKTSKLQLETRPTIIAIALTLKFDQVCLQLGSHFIASGAMLMTENEASYGGEHSTQNPTPQTLNPKPHTQNPQPQTLSTKTSNSQPLTLNPKR